MHPRKTLLHFIYCRGGTQFCSCLLLYSLVILFLIIFWTVGFKVYQHLSSAIIFSTMFPTVSSLHSWHNSSHLRAQRWQWNTVFSGSILWPTLHAVCCICQVHSEQLLKATFPVKNCARKNYVSHDLSWPTYGQLIWGFLFLVEAADQRCCQQTKRSSAAWTCTPVLSFLGKEL